MGDLNWKSFNSKEDQTDKISNSVFVTNFPDHVRARDLWKVTNLERLIENLCTIWIGSFHLHANMVRFKREQKTKSSFPIHDKRPVLDDSCLKERDFSMSVMGKVKDISVIPNLYIILSKEGFCSVNLTYLEGLWVLIALDSLASKQKFLNHVGVGSFARVWEGDRAYFNSNRRSKQDKRFAVCQFIRVNDLDRLVESCTIWIGSFPSSCQLLLVLNVSNKKPLKTIVPFQSNAHGTFGSFVSAARDFPPLIASVAPILTPFLPIGSIAKEGVNSWFCNASNAYNDLFSDERVVWVTLKVSPLHDLVFEKRLPKIVNEMGRGKVFVARAKRDFLLGFRVFLKLRGSVYTSDDESKHGAKILNDDGPTNGEDMVNMPREDAKVIGPFTLRSMISSNGEAVSSFHIKFITWLYPDILDDMVHGWTFNVIEFGWVIKDYGTIIGSQGDKILYWWRLRSSTSWELKGALWDFLYYTKRYERRSIKWSEL
ncbi:hypothetical protein Tco_0938909 [Tanacetum coccineum]|uniref:Uncharacterized protein n=1 Tax=Tanacetum coccineum TaxID=301880 RepID=A0ABQ5DPQ9_9ASTR